MTSLRSYIKRAVKQGGSSLQGSSIQAHISRAIKAAIRNWSKPQVLPHPTSLQAVISWEVNQYLTSIQMVKKEQANTEIHTQTRYTMAKVTAGEATGVLTVRAIDPNVGVLNNGKLVIFTYTETVVLGESFKYWYAEGRYFVKGHKGHSTEQPYGVALGSETFVQQVGAKIQSIWPNPLQLNTQGKASDILDGQNTFQTIYSETSYATVEGTNYVEYVIDPTMEFPRKTKVILTIPLSAYFIDDGRWKHTHPGKLLLYKDIAVLSIVRIEDVPTAEFLSTPALPLESSRAYSEHVGTSWLCHELLLINRKTQAVRHYPVEKSPAQLWVSNTGYLDFLVNTVTGRLIIAKTNSTILCSLTAQAMKFRVGTTDVEPHLAVDAELLSTEDVINFVGEYEGFDSYLETEGSQKVFNFYNYGLTIDQYDINTTTLELIKEEELFTQSETINSIHGVSLTGGYTHAVLGQDLLDGSMFVLRGYEGYLQMPTLASERLTWLTTAQGIVLSGTYNNGLYPGDIGLFGGSRLFDISTREMLADIPGDTFIPLSVLKNDPIGQPALHAGKITSYLVKKFLASPRFSEDSVSSMLRERELSGIFYGGTNDGNMYYKTNGTLTFVHSGNIYLNRLRLVVVRDLSQAKDKQLRFILPGLHSVVDQAAKSIQAVDAQTATMQGGYIITPNKYANTPASYGYAFSYFGGGLPLFDSIAADPATGFSVIWRLFVLKLDFLQLAVDKVYLVANGQALVGWFGTGINAIGEKVGFRYSDCYKLTNDSLNGWFTQLESYEGSRQEFTVTKLEA